MYSPITDISPRLFTPAPAGEAGGPDHGAADPVRELVQGAADRSLQSAELRAAITDWATFQSLSPERANLLRPFAGWLAGARVLEVNCGCGPVTRFLGEAGAQVAALEPDFARAQVAALRCQDLENVSVYADSLAAFNLPGRYGVIVAIGLWEAAQSAFGGSAALEAALARLVELLEDGGALLIAAANPVGLRALNGDGDVGELTPLAGVHGLASGACGAAPGRAEWVAALRSAGLESAAFYYPFPDYVAPRVVLAPEALEHPQLDVGHLAAGASAARMRRASSIAFSELAAWETAARAGSIPQLANAFLIAARRRGPAPALESVAYAYSDARLPGFAKALTFEDRGGTLMAVNRKLYPAATLPPGPVSHALTSQPVLVGRHLDSDLDAVLLRPGWRLDEVAGWAAPWREFLLNGQVAAGMLPPDWIDCVPANVVRGADGRLQVFDLEYRGAEPAPLHFVLFRGLWNSLAARARCAVPESPLRNISAIATAVLELWGPFDAAQLEEAYRLEAELQLCVTGAPAAQTLERLRGTQLDLLPALDGKIVGPPGHLRFQVYWRSHGQPGFGEDRSASAWFPQESPAPLQFRVGIPAGQDLAALRVDASAAAGALVGLRLDLLDSDGRLVAPLTGNCRALRSHQMFFPSPPEMARQQGELALLLGDDPYFEYPLSARESAALRGGGYVEAWVRGACQGAAQETVLQRLLQLMEREEEARRLWDLVRGNEAELARMRNRLSETGERLAEAEHRLDAVLASLSWRLAMAAGAPVAWALRLAARWKGSGPRR